jgi:hypothetical protein
MPVVGVLIDETIGLNGVPSYKNRQSIQLHDRKECEYSLLYVIWK